ncbi:D123-domain-containing protein [Lichtheimia hyalospora FSU 10163]|nr:D123-domain-containing protein [Lichtheimia hyalospora FSU 10163]
MFNNAGIMHPEDDNALTTQERIWDLTMDINVKGVWFGCKYAILAMRESGGGSIINTASFVALMGAATPQLAYTASKGAVLAMTRELAMVHARENIRCNALCPGPLRTPLLMDFLNTEEKKQRRLVHVPQGRFGEAIEQANAALFLASDESSYVTGVDFRVDGGLASAYVTAEGEPTAWYDQFRSVTFESRILPLSSEFVDYLNADGIYLPDDGQPRPATIEEISDDEEAFSDNEQDDNIPKFPEVEQFIRDSVRQLGGDVFPKLNWSSPRDAAWITATQSLKCNSPFDVFLLLKSSDFINHDLNHAFDECEESSTSQQHLVLREWHTLQPSMEFRISQRDLTFYDYMAGIKDDIEEMIYAFFQDHVQSKFPNTSYVMDVYVDRPRHKVWLVDFNPFSPTTDGLLYDWNELIEFDPLNPEFEPEFRIIESVVESRVCNAPRFATNMVPKDVIDLSDGRTVAEFAEEFERAMMLAGQEEDSSSDDNDDEKQR